MAYYIAAASSDGTNVDLHFGSAGEFLIYQVDDDGKFTLKEKRAVPEENAPSPQKQNCNADGEGCGCGGGGCSEGERSARVETISDCRCVVCKKIGSKIFKQLEKKAISAFDVDCTITQALDKITKYFYNIDNHIPLARR